MIAEIISNEELSKRQAGTEQPDVFLIVWRFETYEGLFFLKTKSFAPESTLSGAGQGKFKR
jgi:hypothetical protein